MDKFKIFYEAMKVCASLPCVSKARKLHAQLILTGFGSSVFLRNHLLHMYFSCHLVDDACRVFSGIEFPNVYSWNTMINGLADCGRFCEAAILFQEMSQRDVVTWNTMMSSYFSNGKPRDAVRMFILLLRDHFVTPVSSSFSCVMKACASIDCLRLALQLHGSAQRHGFSDATSVNGSLIDMYIKCGAVSFAERVFCKMVNPNLFCCNSMIYGYSILYGIETALDLFYQMPEHNDVSWSTIISLLCQHGYGPQGRYMIVEMSLQGFIPNSMTYASAISTCSSFYDLDWGRHLHARIFRINSGIDGYIGNALIDMYAKSGFLHVARRIFDSLTEHSVISWTSLISGYVQFGYKEEAFGLFNQMMKFPLVPDAFTIATVLGACAAYEDSILGLQLHGYTVKTGIDSSIPVGNSLITMYGKVGNIQNAEFAFNLMPMRNIISWTAMISAFSHGSNVEKAHEYFDKMPERNVVSWNSMMAAYLQNGFCEEGLQLYILMVGHDMMPDSITFATLISACADFALLEMGKQIMAQAEKSGFALCVSVANSAINMYSKCGQIIEAEKVFNSITSKDVVSWNSLMAAYAQNGQGIKVVETFETMLMLNYAPDCASFVSLLMGCSHAGLVEKGCHYFNAMKHDHGVCPAYEHYACMVDLLSRAGFIECALKVIAEMPFEAAADVWGSLLVACHTHKYTTLVEFAARQLLALEVLGPGGYSLLANMYSDCGKLEHVAGIRKMMRDTGIHKIAGCSWIEVHNRVHVFTAHCSNHPQIADVLKMLEELWNMKDVESNENVEDFLYSGRVELLLV